MIVVRWEVWRETSVPDRVKSPSRTRLYALWYFRTVVRMRPTVNSATACLDAFQHGIIAFLKVNCCGCRGMDLRRVRRDMDDFETELLRMREIDIVGSGALNA